MPLPPQNRSEDLPVNNLHKGGDRAIQDYLAIIDDGELARLAALRAPTSEAFDASAHVAQAAALQAEATAELVRRREVIASSMSQATLVKLAAQLEIEDVGFLGVADDEGFTDPITGPVLRRLASLMREKPPHQDFHDQFLVEDFSAVLSHADTLTALRPTIACSLEDALRYAANIPTNQVSWDILNGAFVDFLRLWHRFPLLAAELFPVQKKAGAKVTAAKFSQLMANLKRSQQERVGFEKTFTPGQDFPPDIDELAYRAYAECWEKGLLGLSWKRRLAWLVVEFAPFWAKHGDAYRSLQKRMLEPKIKKSEKASSSGKSGRQKREAKRWKKVTADFIEFLKDNLKGSDAMGLQSCVTAFGDESSTLRGSQDRTNSKEFLKILCDAVSSDEDGFTLLRSLQGLKAAKIQTLEPKLREKRLNKLTPTQKREFHSKGFVPPCWRLYKELSQEAAQDCLDGLRGALVKVR